jgi:hypothetical protein
MTKPVVLEIHTGRKLARAAARGLKRSGRASRLSVKRDGALYLVRGVAPAHWDEAESPEEYPRRLRYRIAQRKTRKAGLRALARCRKQYKAHYQLLRWEGCWVLATFDRRASEALAGEKPAQPLPDPNREFADAAGSDDVRAYRVLRGED